MSPPRISVIVPARNEEKRLARCLRSLAEQDTREPFEVIVVDNGSTDGTGRVARSFRGTLPVRVVREPRKGRGAARAKGFSVARGEILCSTDADTTVPPSWISEVLRVMESERADAVAGSCRVADSSSKLVTIMMNKGHPLFMRAARLGTGRVVLCGFNFAIRRGAYLRAGGFDPAYDGQEDVDLSRRVGRIARVRFAPSLVVETSGRRFDRGIVRGLSQYVSVFYGQIIRGDTQKALSDAETVVAERMREPPRLTSAWFPSSFRHTTRKKLSAASSALRKRIRTSMKSSS